MGIFELRRISSPPERVTPGSEATHLYSPRAENKKKKHTSVFQYICHQKP